MNGIDQYRQYQVSTASPADQVALLFAGARRFVDQAAAALERKEYSEVSLYTGKAQKILEELLLSLNLEAGEIAQNLFRLYDYWSWRLSQALIHQDQEGYEEVSAALSDLTEAWTEAARKERSQRGGETCG